jgi:hypothetical protein
VAHKLPAIDDLRDEAHIHPQLLAHQLESALDGISTSDTTAARSPQQPATARALLLAHAVRAQAALRTP